MAFTNHLPHSRVFEHFLWMGRHRVSLFLYFLAVLLVFLGVIKPSRYFGAHKQAKFIAMPEIFCDSGASAGFLGRTRLFASTFISLPSLSTCLPFCMTPACCDWGVPPLWLHSLVRATHMGPLAYPVP